MSYKYGSKRARRYDFNLKPSLWMPRRELPHISARPEITVQELSATERRLAQIIDVPVSPTTGNLNIEQSDDEQYDRDHQFISDTENEAELDLLRDLFWQLYKFDPQLVDESRVHADRQLNHAMLSQLTKMDEFEAIRNDTTGRIPSAVSALQPLAHWLHVKYEEFKKLEEERKKLEEAMQQRGGNTPRMRQMMSELQSKMQGMLDPNGSLDANDQTLRDALGQAQQEAERTSEMMDAFGKGIGSQQGDLNQQIKFFSTPSDLIRDIGALLGKLRGGLGKSSKETMTDQGQILTGLKESSLDAIRHLIPEAHAKLAMGGVVKAHGLINIAGGHEMAYSYGSANRDGEFVICVDGSGSMNGQQAIAAASLAIALMLDANEQGRGAHWCSFASKVDFTFDLPGDKRVSPVEITNTLARMTGGGTDFDPPLKWALKQLDTNPNADLVFITDGGGYLQDEVIARVKRRVDDGLGLYLIYIGPGSGHEELTKIATNVAHWTNCSPSEVASVYEQLERSIINGKAKTVGPSAA